MKLPIISTIELLISFCKIKKMIVNEEDTTFNEKENEFEDPGQEKTTTREVHLLYNVEMMVL